MKKLLIILAIIFCTATTALSASIEIVCVLDKSGSMEIVREDIVGSFNTFLSAQKESAPDAIFTLILFDSNSALKTKNIKDFDELTYDQYKTEGNTALYDAIGAGISDLESRITPETIVVFAIITDGEENSSTEYDSDDIKYRISHYENWHPWTFLFLAANQDAFSESQKMGISDGNWGNISLTNSTDCSATFDTLDGMVTDVIINVPVD